MKCCNCFWKRTAYESDIQGRDDHSKPIPYCGFTDRIKMVDPDKERKCRDYAPREGFL